MGQLLSQFGNVFLEVAALWLLQLRSPAYLAAAGVVIMAPTILAAVGGAVVDHIGPRRLMVLTDLSRMTGVALMTLLVVLRPEATPILLLVALGLTSLGAAFFNPSESVMVPEIVDDANLPSANGLMQSTWQSATTAGYVVGGAALAAIGTTVILGFDALTYAISAVTILLIPRPSHERAQEASSAPPLSLEAFQEGFRGLRNLGWLLRMMPTIVILNMILNGAFIMLPYWVHHQLGSGVVVYGVLIGSWTGGQLAGSLGAGAFRRWPVWQVTTLTALIEGLLFLTFGFDLNPVGDAATLIVAGVANGIMNALAMVIMQRAIPPEVRGRAFGLFTSLVTLANPVGPLLGGLTTGFLPPWWLWLIGGLACLYFAYILARSPDLRAIRGDQAVASEAPGV